MARTPREQLLIEGDDNLEKELNISLNEVYERLEEIFGEFKYNNLKDIESAAVAPAGGDLGEAPGE